MKSDLTVLAQSLEYRFNDIRLLEMALNHRSFRGYKNNERLEFLGDAILNFVIASALFRRNPRTREGQLSRFRAHLVCGETLSLLAQHFKLGMYLRLGAGELKTGGAQRDSILADGMEAVVAAIYLDGGIAACESCILNWYADKLAISGKLPDFKDPKTRLQEYLQARKLSLPNYVILAVEGAAHQQIFKVACTIDGVDQPTMGQGSGRRRAEQEAAQHMLQYLKISDEP